MNISLSEHFTYGKLLKFTFPSMIMMILTSIYGVVDGVFISNFIGAEPFAAINIVMPFLMIFGSVGFMLGTRRQRACCLHAWHRQPQEGK